MSNFTRHFAATAPSSSPLLCLLLLLAFFPVDSRVRAGEDGARHGAHQRAGAASHVGDGPGPRAHASGRTPADSSSSFYFLEKLCQEIIHSLFFLSSSTPQSLQTDAYDHYSAIYSLLADRLKKHKTLRVAQPTPRPISYPLNAVQVSHRSSFYFPSRLYDRAGVSRFDTV